MVPATTTTATADHAAAATLSHCSPTHVTAWLAKASSSSIWYELQYIQDQQDRELTFKPHVNRKSAMMVERMNREGRLRPTGGRRGYTGTNEDPGHGEDTFAPKINKRSRGLKLKGQVYDRLYESAKAKNSEHAALQEKYKMDHEDFEKLVKLYNDREDFMPKQAALFASAAMTIAVLEKLQSTN